MAMSPQIRNPATSPSDSLAQISRMLGGGANRLGKRAYEGGGGGSGPSTLTSSMRGRLKRKATSARDEVSVCKSSRDPAGMKIPTCLDTEPWPPKSQFTGRDWLIFRE